MKTKTMILCAIFAAVLCIFSVMTIPIGIVPITMGVFGVMFTALVLGPKNGTISVAVYILLGAVGLPIFSGFKGGPQVIAGPTGGYIWSYIFMALIIGSAQYIRLKNKWAGFARDFLACVVAVSVCYFFGTLQFIAVQKTSWGEALGMCVIPFIPFDLAKAFVAVYLAYAVKLALSKAGMLTAAAR